MKKFILMQGEDVWIEEDLDGTQYIFDASIDQTEICEEVATGVFTANQATPPTDNSIKINIRKLFEQAGPVAFQLAGCAHQLLHWRNTHKFCGICGKSLIRHQKEHAMYCETCNLCFFPRINPVVIILIHRGNSILLAKRADSGFNHFWSVIAGFVEPGESLENAVRREIKEEVNINVKNIRFITSQQWPFPNNLMAGFYAEYASGTVKPDGEEIDEAAWFTKDTLPRIPSKVSIARHLIDSFFGAL